MLTNFFFQRAYWLRHFKFNDDDRFTPHECPFKDPTVKINIKQTNPFFNTLGYNFIQKRMVLTF